MRHLVAGLFVVVLASCARNVPSPGCGFDVHITNNTGSQMTVDVNQQRKGTVEPGGGLYVFDGDPPLPWDVVVRRASDGTQLVARHYERTDQSQELTVTDTNVGLATQNCL